MKLNQILKNFEIDQIKDQLLTTGAVTIYNNAEYFGNIDKGFEGLDNVDNDYFFDFEKAQAAFNECSPSVGAIRCYDGFQLEILTYNFYCKEDCVNMLNMLDEMATDSTTLNDLLNELNKNCSNYDFKGWNFEKYQNYSGQSVNHDGQLIKQEKGGAF